MHHPLAVGDQYVLAPQAEAHQQVEAGDRRGSGPGTHQFRLGDVLADKAQPVQHRGGGDDRGAVLVVVEHRDLQPVPQLALDVEALGRLDVLEIDAAKGRLERGDDVDQLVRIVLVEFDVEDVDAGELLEETPLAFHHRFAGERTDISQAQHRGAVGHHADQVAARRQRVSLTRVANDFVARLGHAR